MVCNFFNAKNASTKIGHQRISILQKKSQQEVVYFRCRIHSFGNSCSLLSCDWYYCAPGSWILICNCRDLNLIKIMRSWGANWGRHHHWQGRLQIKEKESSKAHFFDVCSNLRHFTSLSFVGTIARHRYYHSVWKSQK